MSDELKTGVMGAGAIGCFVGGKLAAAGADVVFVGRDRTRRELEACGLLLTDLEGASVAVPAAGIAFSSDVGALADRDVVLVCVKSGQTAEVGAQLAHVLAPGTVVVSLQNGLHNPQVLRERLPGQLVLGGIVTFNVVWRGPGSLRRATSGPLAIEASTDPRAARLAAALAGAGIAVQMVADLRPLQWTKLVLNLSNALGALLDVPTRELVFVPAQRRILAAVLSEALAVLRAAGIHPPRLGTPIPVRLLPLMLRLPTAVLRVVARAQVRIDPEARSSMWDDLSKGRTTEIEQLNAEIVRLAEARGRDAPVNRRLVELVHEAEARGTGSPKLSAAALWAELQRARAPHPSQP